MSVSIPQQKSTTSCQDESTRLATIQQAYGASCSQYEILAEKKLKGDTVVLSGYGCSLRVKHNALEVFPGKTHAAQKQETRMLYPGVHDVKQIILLSQKGMVTLDAISWAKAQNIHIIVMNHRGELVQSLSPESRSSIFLKRMQYQVYGTPVPGIVACQLIHRKIQLQSETLEDHPELPQGARALEILKDALSWFNLPALPERFYDLKWLMLYEGRCAQAYFQSWKGLPIAWKKTDLKTIPPHWKIVSGERSSPLSKGHGARHAVDPLNAVLNYAYALLEAQCRQALISRGFDLSCGFLHADTDHRDSLVYDLMESQRPKVDHLVLKLFKEVTLSRAELMSTRDGTVEFNPQFARYLVASCRLQQEEINLAAYWLETELAAALAGWSNTSHEDSRQEQSLLA